MNAIKKRIKNLEKKVGQVNNQWALDHARKRLTLIKKEGKEYTKEVYEGFISGERKYNLPIPILLVKGYYHANELAKEFMQEYEDIKDFTDKEGLKRWAKDKIAILLELLKDYDPGSTQDEIKSLGESCMDKYTTLDECIKNEKTFDDWRREQAEYVNENETRSSLN